METHIVPSVEIRREKPKAKEKERRGPFPSDIGLAQLTVTDGVPVKTMRLAAEGNVFNGLRVPVDPPKRAIDWMLKSASEITKASILRDPIDAFIDVADQAVAASVRNAQQIYRSKSHRTEETLAKTLAVDEWPIWLAIKSVGRGGWLYQGLGSIIDRMGWGGKYPAQIDTFLRQLKEVWNVRIERDKELSQSTSRTRYPVEAKLKRPDHEVLRHYKEKGYDEELVIQAKIVDVQIRIVEEASEVFRYLYRRKYNTEFSPVVSDKDTHHIHMIREKRVSRVLKDFYSLTQTEIADILLAKDGVKKGDPDYTKRFAEKTAQVFQKEDYLTFFTHSVRERGIQTIKMNSDRFFGYEYKGARYLIQYHFETGRTLSFHEILLEMDRNKALIDASRQETDVVQGRRDANSAFISLQQDNSVLLSENKIRTYFKERVKPGVSGKQINGLIADIEAWQKADFYVSVDAMNGQVFGYDPASGEMDNGWGKAVQWDVSRRGQDIVVNQKNIHKIADAGHVKESLNHLLDIAFRDLNREEEINRVPPSHFRHFHDKRSVELIDNTLLPTVSQKLGFGWVSDQETIFKPVSDYPRELFAEEKIPVGIIVGFEAKAVEFKAAVKATLDKQVAVEQKPVDKMFDDLDSQGLIDKLQREIIKNYQLQIETRAQEIFREQWQQQNQTAVATMTLSERHQHEIAIYDSVRMEVETEFREDLIAEFKIYQDLWGMYGIETRDKQIAYHKQQIAEGVNDPSISEKLETEIREQRGKLTFFAEEAKRLIKERISGREQTPTESAIPSAIEQSYGQMHLGRPSPMTLNMTSRLFAQAQKGVMRNMPSSEQEGGDMPVERIMVQLPSSERLEISTVAADKLLVAAAADCFESLNQQNVDIDSTVQDWKALVQRIEINAGIVCGAEIFWSLKMLSNTALITAGSGDIREDLLNWLTSTVNQAVNAQYHSRGMSSWINKKDPNSRFSRFATALVEGTENVEGDVSDGENTEVIYRMTTERFLEKAEKSAGASFQEADTEKRQAIIAQMQIEAQTEADRYTKMKMFTFTMMGITEEDLKRYYAEWMQPAAIGTQNMQQSYMNSFLNYIIWTRGRKRGLLREEMAPLITPVNLASYKMQWSGEAKKDEFYRRFDNYCAWMKSRETGTFGKLMTHYDYANMKFVY